MNIHPVLIHFPIALLTLYALLELIRYTKWGNFQGIFHTKAILSIVGIMLAIASIQTGEIAQETSNTYSHALVRTHALFANISTWIFCVIAFVYLIVWFRESSWYKKILASKIGEKWQQLERYAILVLQSPLIPLLALLGLAAITITGALGGAIVYGPDADPVVKFIYHLFF